MNITSAQYITGVNVDGSSNGENAAIIATIDDVTLTIPLDPANRHYAEIMRQVDAGTLTIQDAD
jgi:hypothetical protein